MQTTIAELLTCGTKFPIWMNGKSFCYIEVLLLLLNKELHYIEFSRYYAFLTNSLCDTNDQLVFLTRILVLFIHVCVLDARCDAFVYYLFIVRVV